MVKSPRYDFIWDSSAIVYSSSANSLTLTSSPSPPDEPSELYSSKSLLSSSCPPLLGSRQIGLQFSGNKRPVCVHVISPPRVYSVLRLIGNIHIRRQEQTCTEHSTRMGTVYNTEGFTLTRHHQVRVHRAQGDAVTCNMIWGIG